MGLIHHDGTGEHTVSSRGLATMVDLVSDYVLWCSTPRLPKNGPFSLAAVDNSLKVPSLYLEIYWVFEGESG